MQAVWLEVCETFKLILHPPASNTVEPVADGGTAASRCTHDKQWEPIEEAVLDCLADTVLSSTSHIPSRVRRDLVAMVAEGCSADTPAAVATGGRMAFLCLRKLCVLCGRGAGSGSDRGASHTCPARAVACIAMPELAPLARPRSAAVPCLCPCL